MRLPLDYYAAGAHLNPRSLGPKVTQFQEEKMGKVMPSMPTPPSQDQIMSMIPLMYEEYRELSKGLMNGDLEQIADGAADAIYILYGILLECGIDPDMVLHEVHNANMEKGVAAPGCFGRTTKYGTSTKAKHTPPRIRELLQVMADRA